MNEQTNQQTDFANQWITKQAAIDALGEKPLVWDDLSDFDLGKAAQWADDVDAIKDLLPYNQLATDCVSRQAAIRWVKTECNPYGKPTLDFESGKKVIEHLEQMPSAQPQPLIDQLRWERDIAVKQLHDLGYEFGEAVKEAQPQRCEDCVNFSKTRLLIPQPEIIRCKDCKWFNNVGCAIEIVDELDNPTENDFCSFAERKEE